MARRKLVNRREFLRFCATSAAGATLAACATPATPTPTPQPATAVPTRVAVLTTPTPAPTPAVAATKAPLKYNESPKLAELVKAGKLPPVEKRLPEEPLVVKPLEEVGQYGGGWNFGFNTEAPYPYWQTYDYEFFVRWDPDWTTVLPNLAVRWESSPDAKEWVFHLRRGVKWSDGQPFTADDVMFWYEDIAGAKELSPVFPSQWTVGGQPMKVTKVDDYTVRLAFNGPFPLLLFMMARMEGGHLYAPKHYLKQFHAKYADKAALDKATKDAKFENWWQLFNLKNDVLSNAERPTLDAWQVTVPRGGKIAKSERNPYYWKVDTAGNQLPYLDEVQWKGYGSSEALFLAALAGELDYQHTFIRDKVENLALLEENKAKGGYRIYFCKEDKFSYTAILFNLAHKDPVKNQVLNQKDFRIALSYATNRPDIAATVWRNLAKPRQVAPWDENKNYDLKKLAYQHLDYDPKKANEMLDKLYPKKDGEGYRLGPDGKRLSFVMEVSQAYQAIIDAVEIMKRNWKDVGVEISTKVDSADLFTQRQQAGDHDMVATRFTDGGMFPILNPRFWVPTYNGANALPAAWALWLQTGGKSGVEPPAAAKKCYELYQQAVVETDQAKQDKLMQQIFDINADEFWTMGVIDYPKSFGVVKNDFRNVPMNENQFTGWMFPGPAPFNPCTFFRKK